MKIVLLKISDSGYLSCFLLLLHWLFITPLVATILMPLNSITVVLLATVLTNFREKKLE
jgi:cation transport ATPase